MKNSPGIDCFIWFMGDASEPSDLEAAHSLTDIRNLIKEKDNFDLVTMNEIAAQIENFDPVKIAFMYNLVELQTTIKPFAFQYTFQEIGADSAIFLDNDIWVVSSLEEIQDELSRRSVVVTPHISSPIPEDGMKPKDKDMLQAGVFNFGFVAFSNTPTAGTFLTWWGERLTLYGYVNVKRGMFYDQNWGMFIPAFFDHDDYVVIRDPRYNIAYWNLHYTGAGLHMKGGLPHIEDAVTGKAKKAVFVHFSGMSLLENYEMKSISHHQTRYTLRDYPRMKDVLLSYMELVDSHDTMRYRNISYGYEKFSDGSKIENCMRVLYAAAVYPIANSSFILYDAEPPYDISLSPYLRESFQKRVFNDPFCVKEKCHSDSNQVSFLEWFFSTSPGKAVDMDGAFYFSILEEVVWNQRNDLQKAYPDPAGVDYDEFKKWFRKNPVDEGIFDADTIAKWMRKWSFHKSNHLNFHKKVVSVEDIGINVIGWHAGLFSIGISALKIYRAATLSNISANPIESVTITGKHFMLPSHLDFVLTRSCSEAVNLVIMNAGETSYFKNDIPKVIRDQKYNVGYWAWELDIFPKYLMPFLADYDEIWCPSSFIKQSIESSPGYDGTLVKVLPIPIETLTVTRTKEDTIAPTFLGYYDRGHVDTEHFVFLVVFDFHSFEERKNPAAAIRAFIEAFPPSRDPMKKFQLIIKSHSGNVEEVGKLKKVSKGDSRVFFIDELLTDVENEQLHSYQDCYISLHRSEGYGMNILEAMANGIPVIATNYSGNVDFFNQLPTFEGSCTYPIPYNLVKLEKSYGPYTKGNHWADPSHNHVVSAMREVAKNDCKNTNGKEMSRQINSRFGPKAIGERLKYLLAESLPAIIAKNDRQPKIE
eukprot:scaffold15932_cov95-Attheya_sp.AAC.4